MFQVFILFCVFFLQAEDLEVLPGQADLTSDRGSRYATLIFKKKLLLVQREMQPACIEIKVCLCVIFFMVKNCLGGQMMGRGGGGRDTLSGLVYWVHQHSSFQFRVKKKTK